MTREPRTEAGKRLVADLVLGEGVTIDLDAAIVAIEAEAATLDITRAAPEQSGPCCDEPENAGVHDTFEECEEVRGPCLDPRRHHPFRAAPEQQGDGLDRCKDARCPMFSRTHLVIEHGRAEPEQGAVEGLRHDEPGTCTACGQVESHEYHRKHGRRWDVPYHPFYPQAAALPVPASREAEGLDVARVERLLRAAFALYEGDWDDGHGHQVRINGYADDAAKIIAARMAKIERGSRTLSSPTGDTEPREDVGT